jgi:triosephosphate isomerase
MAKKSPVLIVFNWKENPRTSKEAIRLAAAVNRVSRSVGKNGSEVVICPPLLYLAELSKKIGLRSGSRCALGVQDVFWENGGAYTGEIGPAMVRAAGENVRYVVIGHSERRRFLGETDETIQKKIRASLAAGLRVILCVGEPGEVRKKGVRAAQQYVKDQLKKDLQNIGRRVSGDGCLIVAYEPIWAIGTGRNCPPPDARDMAEYIERIAHAPVLYGGSVDATNIKDYLCYTEIHGALVGGASLRADQIKKIVSLAAIKK